MLVKVLIHLKSFLDRGIDWRNRIRQGALGEFYRHGGNELLVSKFELTSNDWIVDAGGFRGEWSDEMLCRYGAKVVIFEPNPPYAAQLRDRYMANDRVELIEAALSEQTGHRALSLCGEGSTLMSSTSASGTIDVQLVDVRQLFQKRFSSGLGCLKLNVEGAEYEILEKLLSTGQVSGIRFILVQFHKGPLNCIQRREQIQMRLSESHNKVFDFPFVWELWREKTKT
jgi:FkbM family methyltransferase